MDKGISWGCRLKTDKAAMLGTRSDTEVLDGKGLSFFLLRTLGDHRRETHRGSPSTQRAQELQALPKPQTD